MDAPERDCCPFVDLGHASCGDRFRLDSLNEVLETCFSDAHSQCPSYTALNRNFGESGPPPVAVVITVSLHGQPQQLRPTGS